MNILAPLPVVVPLAGAATILLFTTVLSRRAIRVLSMATVLAEVGIAVGLVHATGSGSIVYWFGGWTPSHGVALGVSFTVDQLGAGCAVLAGVIVAAAVAATHRSLDDAAGIAHALLLVLLAAMAGFCLTGDLFNMFVFFELMAVSAFGLAAYHTRSLAALRSALNFAITNSVGAFLVLIGIALLYARTGALNLAQIGRHLAAAGPVDRLVVVAFSVLLAGFLIKAAVVPFHFWLIDTASGAPVPLALILAGALDMLGVYAIARVYWTVFATPVAGHQRAVQAVLISVGALSAVVAGTLALVFHDPRRRIAFVMVGHTGILLIGVGCLSARGVAASAVYAAGDGAVKASLWTALALLGFTHPDDDEQPGLTPSRAGRRAGLVLMTAGGLAIAGLPLFATGVGKSAIEDAAAAAGYPWVIPVAVLAAALTGAAVLQLAWALARDAGSRAGVAAGNHDRSWHVSFATGAALLVASAAAVFLGRWARAAGARFVDTAGYQHRVLGGGGPGGGGGSVLRLSGWGLLLDLLAVAAAVGLAGSLSRSAYRGAAGGLGAVLHRAARSLHAGSIGDSATWATVGTAAIALVLALGVR